MPAASGPRQGQRLCDRLVQKATNAAAIRLQPAALAQLMLDYDAAIDFIEVHQAPVYRDH